MATPQRSVPRQPTGWWAFGLGDHPTWTLPLIGTLLAALLLGHDHYLSPHTRPVPSPASYSIRLLSWDPLIIYIIDFISPAERKALLNLGVGRETLFERSKVYYDGEDSIDPARSSTTAFLPDADPITERIIARASELQGYTPRHLSESLQLTRYNVGQYFYPHFDPLEVEGSLSVHRLTTIFAFLEATCTECGTQFPNIHLNWSAEHPSWCDYVDCQKRALTVKAIPGNAVLWKSWNSSGHVDVRTLHAGLPPEKGVKTGLNIWTNG
ncbi:hypothetical protein CORC01_09847 [Colletotrichum orchidophilum]|uniref:Prolyl 4-hydroxylase alpha subunit domain-containing protein n=1 Tax=Colletotrichum orchidophilum TaxID=1209926 RepID=A0A1G4B082_9PEZI|nr:uncharacterized protein CORC01_09847 [Colletotrichum orchidophilum]OHE94829.1 hypothetical protein CORC01_09847 [Colletotrichum orchidophilum]